MDLFKISSEKVKAAAADSIEQHVACCIFHHRSILGSPIELMLLEAVVAYHICEYRQSPTIHPSQYQRSDRAAWEITPQAQISDFRVDFLIEDTHYDVRVIVECDGHDFHERTKQQAKKDRHRDRELQAGGYLVLRYTGSEIWADPWGCADDIQQKIWAVSRARSAA